MLQLPELHARYATARYAVIELELLAVAWAITNTNCKLSYPTLYFAVITDHHPLIPILNSHQLDEIEDPRLQHLKTRVMAYNFTAEWVKDTLNNAPDMLSWNPISDPQQQEMLAERDMNNNPEISPTEIRLAAINGQESIRIQQLREYAKHDQEYQLTTATKSHRPRLPRPPPPVTRRVQKILEHKTPTHN